MVQRFCDDPKVWGQGPRWAQRLCESSFMGARKRAVVGLLLGTELGPGAVAPFVEEVCGSADLGRGSGAGLGACTVPDDQRRAPPTKASACRACVEVTTDAEHTRRVVAGAVDAASKEGRERSRVDTLFEAACAQYPRRHRLVRVAADDRDEEEGGPRRRRTLPSAQGSPDSPLFPATVGRVCSALSDAAMDADLGLAGDDGAALEPGLWCGPAGYLDGHLVACSSEQELRREVERTRWRLE